MPISLLELKYFKAIYGTNIFLSKPLKQIPSIPVVRKHLQKLLLAFIQLKSLLHMLTLETHVLTQNHSTGFEVFVSKTKSTIYVFSFTYIVLIHENVTKTQPC